MKNPSCLLSLTFLLVSLVATSVHGQGTSVGFYSATCPNAESIVKSTVQNHFQTNSRIAPGLLRMFFHDCFVRGCDGSVLITGSDTERSVPQNLNIPGYSVIDDAKAQLEAACPGVVSCADILALAARDAVVETRGVSWDVPTGRRDGRVSVASEASSTLPAATDSILSQIDLFDRKGLNTQDLVVLVGGHTIGTSACRQFVNRLYNFSTTTGADESIDPTFVETLRALCPQGGDGGVRVDLDNGSGGTFDTSYFDNLSRGRGILASDQGLWTDPSTRTFVERLLGTAGQALDFDTEFASSMIKMGNIGVNTGTEGEIRSVCTAFN